MVVTAAAWATAAAWVQSLAWELPHATGVAKKIVFWVKEKVEIVYLKENSCYSSQCSACYCNR